jgi:RNA polymerase primary sigma factor
MNRISRQHLQEFGFEPDASILAEKMEIPEDKIRKIMKFAKEPVSLDTPIPVSQIFHNSELTDNFFEESTYVFLIDLIPAPIEEIQSTQTDLEQLKVAVKDTLNSITPTEAKILRMRFGIDMPSDYTLEEVGQHFDVTRERIRQIEANALRKIKHPSRADILRRFMESRNDSIE